MTALDARFLGPPLAHRGYHDRLRGRVENSLAAARAAVAQGYGIECDVQMSRDGQAMVFHDYDLKRLTGVAGPLAMQSAEVLGKTLLTGGAEGIPTLAQLLETVAGRVPLLIEIKDQDGALGPNVGALEAAVAAALEGYAGPVAVMSFNPHSVAAMARLAPGLARGMTVGGPDDSTYRALPRARTAEILDLDGFDAMGASFVSQDYHHLDTPAVARMKARGVPVLCWTTRSPEAEAEARRIADNVTFEGYPAAPGP